MFDAQKLLNALAGGADGNRDLSDAVHRGQQMASEAATQAAAAVSGALGQAQSRLQGSAASDYAGKAKEIVDQNPITTAAALGGLAALLLGTPAGRSVTGGLVRMGGLAAIGVLAYNAVRNYQDDRPPTAGVPGLHPDAAPRSIAAFADRLSNDAALLVVRAMVATAAADGFVEAAQRHRILGKIKVAGLDASALEFLDREIQHPAAVAELAAAVGSSKELASHVYAGARLIAKTPAETTFLAQLARALNLETEPVGHINAAALGAVPTTP
jgi:uncharacterized membrane protein YebE (DUF533 family)